MPPRLTLVDGSAAFYRAFFAVRGLTTSKGMPTNAVYGFTTLLQKVLRLQQPDAAAVVFDAPGRTFRDDLYDDYKATRDAMPEDLARQLPLLKEVTRAFNVETLEIPGVEADDVLSTLACRAAGAGWDVVIVTGDKDFMQVVSKQTGDPEPGITLYDDMKDLKVGIDEVIKKFGVPPENVVDVLALMGDSSDNIPGVKGIGPKYASELIAAHGSLDGLLAGLDQVKPRFRKALEAGREDAILSRTLATIKLDVDVPFDPERLARREPDLGRLTELFTELEFNRLLQDLGGDVVEKKTLSYERYRTIGRVEELEPVCAAIREAGVLCVDLETTSTEPVRARIVGIALCAREGEAVYVPTGHAYLGAPPQVSLDDALAALRPVLTDPAVRKVGQNLKYDALVLERYGVEVSPVSFDTMVGAYLINPDAGPFNLDALARKHLGHRMISFEEVAGKGKAQVTFDQVEVERARDYACEDADAALRLAPILEEKVRADGMGELLDLIERPLIRTLIELERNGVGIDGEHFAALAREFEKKMAGAMKEVFRVAGEEFNVDSPKQLRRILFEKLKLPPGKRTKTGYSTDMSVLEKLAPAHELPARILEYRTLAKLKNTYIDALPGLVNPETGRIHTSYNQAVAATGRLSSSGPNLQNIPIRTPEGKLIRKGFVPAPGRVYVGADYSQIELRVMAHLSEDERLLQAFSEGQDIHAATAQEIFGSSEGESRRRAKAINFGIIFGMSAYGLAQRLSIDQKEAQEFINLYFSRYPRVRTFIDATIKEAEGTGYVRTMFGRRRYVPDLRSRNRMIRGAAERVAVNAPIQGTAADLMKLAMIRVSERLRGTGTLPILQVHDELVLEAEESAAGEAEEAVRDEMEKVRELKAPLKVGVGRGKNWADLKI